MALIDINEGLNSVELDFSPSGIVRKTSYPKQSFGFLDYKDFVGTMTVQITAISVNLTPSQIVGVAFNEITAPPDDSIIMVRNWNGTLIQSTEELYEKLKTFVNS
jgi:hypothetical protein